MKKGKITVAISLAIVCVVLITIMFAQFRTVEETDITGIKTATETELRTMLSSWKTKYEEVNEELEDTQSKIQEYKERIEANEESEELLQEELEKTNMLAGKTDVVGEGIIVTLSDNEQLSISVTNLLELVNELRLAGAEAISINDERVISTTEIVQVNNNILVNTQRVISPYVVKAIGNQTYLSSALSLKNSGYIDTLTNSGRSVSMVTEKNVNILAYKGTQTLKYAKEVEE